MRRFYCTICKKVKHVRKMPVTVTTPMAEKVADRVGECSFHSRPASVSRVKEMSRERVFHQKFATKKAG